MTERRPDLIPAWVDGTLTPVDKLRAHQEGCGTRPFPSLWCAGVRS